MLTTVLIARTGWHLGTRHYSDWNGRDQATQCRHAPDACLVSNPSRTTTQAEGEGQVEWQLSRLCGQMSHQRHGSTTHRWRAVEGTDTILQSSFETNTALHQHPFLSNPKPKSILVELVEKCKKVIQQRGYALYESDEDEGMVRDAYYSGLGVWLLHSPVKKKNSSAQ